MNPIFDLHARVYLTAIGMEVPGQGQEGTGEEKFDDEQRQLLAAPGRFSRLRAWLKAALAPPRAEDPVREELSLDASRWLGL